MAISEMSIYSGIGIKISKPKKFLNLAEYFFGEDQGRYLVEVDSKMVDKVIDKLKKNNIHYEKIGITQKNFIELPGEFKLNTLSLKKINDKWYHKY